MAEPNCDEAPVERALPPTPPAAIIKEAVRGYDIIGDVAVVKIAGDSKWEQTEVGRAMQAVFPNVRLVARRDGDCTGEFRLMPLQPIAGDGGFATLHREYGLRLHVDPSRVYYSPRSGAERFRLANLVQPEERVLVMFSGVAPLPLMIARYSQAAEIVGVEKNPHAHRLGLENLRVNVGGEAIRLHEGDVALTVPKLRGTFDRVAMPFPLSAAKYLGVALESLRSGGKLHYYDFREKGCFEEAVATIKAACAGMGRRLEACEVHACGHVSVRRYRICVDAVIT